MDGLFTVFGLGTAFGIFCSWVYDLIRQRNLPAAPAVPFEQVHGEEVLPAPEPAARAAASVAPQKHVQERSSAQQACADVPAAGSNGEPTIVARKETQFFEPGQSQEAQATPVPTPAPDEASPFTNAMPDVEFIPDEQAASLPTPIHPDFVDTVSFDATDTELPSTMTTVVPRVVLLVNNTLVREVKENDLESIFNEFGIAQGSEDAQTLLSGSVVHASGKSIQLAQA